MSESFYNFKISGDEDQIRKIIRRIGKKWGLDLLGLNRTDIEELPRIALTQIGVYDVGKIVKDIPDEFIKGDQGLNNLLHRGVDFWIHNSEVSTRIRSAIGIYRPYKDAIEYLALRQNFRNWDLTKMFSDHYSREDQAAQIVISFIEKEIEFKVLDFYEVIKEAVNGSTLTEILKKYDK